MEALGIKKDGLNGFGQKARNSMEQYSFDSLGQMVPCPDREKCGAYKCPPLPDGTPRGCTGERKWCKMKFKESEEK